MSRKLTHKELIAASQRLEYLRRVEDFDPDRPGSRPTSEQQAAIDDYCQYAVKNLFITGGNRCLAGGTLVATPRGAIPIEELQVGDIVYDEDGIPIKIIQTFRNGTKQVGNLIDEDGVLIARCTKNHMFAQRNGDLVFAEYCEDKWVPLLFLTENMDLTIRYCTWNSTTDKEVTYDIHVDSTTNLYKLQSGVITHNSGKSQLLRRFVAWFLAEPEEAPWKRRPEWKGPLLGMLVTKSHKQLEGSIVAGIKKFFAAGEIKVIRNGHYIEQLLHVKTGNIVYCFVHENSSQCRERVQSFAAHCSWLDEMPMGESGFKLLEELSKSVTDTKGVFSTHFTPKSINKQIKTYVESMKRPTGAKHSLSFVNNPGIDQEAKETRIAEIRALPVHMQETVLTGGWMKAEQAVYTVPDEALRHPVGYNPYIWRHLICVDPGLASFQGVVVLAEDPAYGHWYVIFSEKQEKIDDNARSVEVIWELISKYRWNVTRIIYDPSARFWFTEARKHPELRRFKISSPFNKNNTDRRLEMISNLQIALGTSIFIPSFNEDLLDEFTICEWSDSTADRIKKSQKFHLIDALRYGVDCLPKWEGKQTVTVNSEEEARWYHLRKGHETFEKNSEKKQATGWRNGRIVGTQRVVLRR